jgi:hypothetical protein
MEIRNGIKMATYTEQMALLYGHPATSNGIKMASGTGQTALLLYGQMAILAGGSTDTG